MLKKVSLLFLCTVSFSLMVPSVHAGRSSHEQRIEQLERTVSSQINVDLLNKVSSLQDEIARLRGFVDEQQHELGLINKRQESLFNDLDRRLENLALGSGSSEKKKLSDSVAQNVIPISDGVVTDTVAYSKAYELVTLKKFKEAELAFTDFIWRFPDSELLVNAHYWKGEIYLQNWRDDKHDTLSLTKAREVFVHISDNYKEHHKATDSMVKLGMIAHEEGDNAKAKEIYQSVINIAKKGSSVNIAKLQLEKLK
ncbi:MAG: tetratricopeptide repeat protein [Francisellaceae bacterium]|nr:tetratricopeptide repeat protein [Francisellaceae bacterium]